jgi:hypothetical protein
MIELANFAIETLVEGEPIPKITALKLIQTYRDTHGWEDGKTKGVWFSKDDFIEILGMITRLNCDGMRIYLGRYPIHEDLPGTPDPVKYRDRVTVVFVPTRNKVNIFNIEEDVEVVENKIRILGEDDDDEPSSFNHGDLEP